MRYDFRKVQEKIELEGLTYSDVADLAKGQFHPTTVEKALKRGTASQRTAKALVQALGLSMRHIRIPSDGRAA